MQDKESLRKEMRRLRREHVAALSATTSALLFRRPPAALADLVPEGGTVGLYHATFVEAPTLSYAKWFYENGRRLALPWFADRDAPMKFRAWHNPWDEEELEPGPFSLLQPPAHSEELEPQVVVMPLLAFTERGERLGQGGGHYDRWLAANPRTVPVGLAWDCQLVDALPVEPHDRNLHAIVTPTRLYEGSP